MDEMPYGHEDFEFNIITNDPDTHELIENSFI